MKRSLAGLVLLPFLAACGGGVSATSPLPSTVIGAFGSLSEAQSDAQYEATRKTLSSPGANDLLYVGNTGNNSITVYRHDASGNTPPLYVIAGSNTGISSPGQLSGDAQGNLYVANGSLYKPSASPSILVFAPGAHGNVAPTRKLMGPLTLIHNVTAMTVDKITGKIFVSDVVPRGEGDAVTLLRFPPNATGDIAPFAHSANAPTGSLPFIPIATALASDSTGRNLIETTSPNQQSDNGNGYGIAQLVKQFANNTPLNTMYGISHFLSNGVADDSTTKTYLVSNSQGIYRFSESTKGSGSYRSAPESYTPAAVSIITSNTCGGQIAVAPGPTPNTYVMTGGNSPVCPAKGVYVYINSASGNAKPLRILSGSATQMNEPFGIYEGI